MLFRLHPRTDSNERHAMLCHQMQRGSPNDTDVVIENAAQLLEELTETFWPDAFDSSNPIPVILRAGAPTTVDSR